MDMQTPPTDPTPPPPVDPQAVPQAPPPPNYQQPPQQAYVPPISTEQGNMLVGRFVGLLIDSLIAAPLYWLAIIPVVGFVGAPALVAYWLCRDAFFGNQSIGKKVMGLQVVCDDGTRFSFGKSAMRNIAYLPLIVLVIPLFGWLILPVNSLLMIVEVVLVLVTGKRMGDFLGNTRVVPAPR